MAINYADLLGLNRGGGIAGSIAQGVQQGMQAQQLAQQAEAQRQNQALRRAQMDMQERQLQFRVDEAQYKRQQSQQYYAAIDAATPEQLSDPEFARKLMMRFPSVTTTLTKANERFDELSKRRAMKDIWSIQAPLEYGNIKLAVENTRAVAGRYRDKGQEAQAKLWEDMANNLQEHGPTALRSIRAALIGRLMPLDPQAPEKCKKLQELRLAERTEDLDVKKKELENKKLRAELLNSLEAKKKAGLFKDVNERFNAEHKLSTQYYKEIGGVLDIIDGGARIKKIMDMAPSGVGDFALAQIFLKMTDPRSVARESEVAAVMKSRGWGDSVSMLRDWISSGKKLTPTQRSQIYEIAMAMSNAVRPRYDRVRGNLETRAKEFGLNPDNIFGENAFGAQKAPDAARADSANAPARLPSDIQEIVDSLGGAGKSLIPKAPVPPIKSAPSPTPTQPAQTPGQTSSMDFFDGLMGDIERKKRGQ